MILDAILIALALGIATSFRPALNDLALVKYIPGPVQLPNFPFLFFPVIWTLTLYFFSVYDGRRNLRIWKEIASLSGGSLLAMALMAGILYLSFRDISRLLFLSFVALAFILILTWRILYRIFFRFGILKGVQSRKLLIVGSGPSSAEIERAVLSYQNLGLTLIGFVDDTPDGAAPSQKLIGPISSARHIVQEYRVDDVVITATLTDYAQLFRLISELSTLPVKIWIIPDYFKPAVFKTKIDEYAGIPMLDLRAPGLTDTQRVVKRSFDLFLTLLLSPIYLPLMGVTALLVYFDSPGPVLFRQVRAGENGRIFQVYKFRTMVANAEDFRHLVEHTDSQGHTLHKTQDDPRVTKIGRLLRRTSLDELPQFYNVLRGEMSLVGPRPELPDLVEKYELWQYKRFSVPPGMTGWWQIHGRSDRPLHLNTQDDLYYIDNYSIFLDITILIRTIGAVIRRKGAY
jgi:exopolysaccharide biosynthesis polyprenyl glycosylphosphotransferase